MLFAITTLTEAGHWNEFSFNSFQLEEGLEMINRLVSPNETLINVYVIEGSSRIQLPTEAFDRTSLSEPIGALQHQWEQVLAEPSPSPAHPDKLIQRAKDACQKRADDLKRCQSHVQLLRERANNALKDQQLKAQLINHYQELIDHYDNQLAKIDSISKGA